MVKGCVNSAFAKALVLLTQALLSLLARHLRRMKVNERLTILGNYVAIPFPTTFTSLIYQNEKQVYLINIDIGIGIACIVCYTSVFNK